MIYPVTFCMPSQRVRPIQTKSKKYSSIIPGEPYSFDDQDAYMDEYATSEYAHTKKKAGFDCFRHLEILASGSVPVFEDPWTIPKGTMSRYDKVLLDKGEEATAEEWRECLRANLTSPAMALYILSMLGVEGRRVLWMDNTTPIQPDYLALGLFYGFKEVCGSDMDVLEEIPYCYKDYDGDISKLYGKGFNYTKLLEPSERKEKTDGSDITEKLRNKDYDLVVFPSILRGTNLHNLQQVLNSGFPIDKIAVCIGEDAPFSSLKEKIPVVNQLASDFNLFVRELD